MYWQAMTTIEAQDLLLKFRAEDYPHLKQDARKKAYKQTYKMAYPASIRTHESEPMNTRQLMARIQELVNGR